MRRPGLQVGLAFTKLLPVCVRFAMRRRGLEIGAHLNPVKR
jgi:hypothetical protein